TEGSAVRSEADRFEVGMYLNYAFNQLVVVDQSNDVSDKFVSSRLGVDVLGSVTIIGPFSLGLGVPFFLAQDGDDADLDGDLQPESPSFAGFGVIRIVPKVRILDDREDLFGLAITGELRVPSHAGDFAGGARMIAFAPRVVGDHRFGASGFRLGANAGVTIREGTTFENVNALSEFLYSAAVSYRFGGWDGIAAIGAELNGGTGLTSDPNFEELPLEGLLFGAVYPTNEWTVSFGPGVGIVPGYGIPTFRFFAGVRYAPTNNDRDGDGIPDDEDACPDTPEDRDGYEDSDGCPEEDPPPEPEVLDRDRDGVTDVDDKCPDEKETINGIDDDDGCPDEGAAKVVRKATKLEVLENIEFATGSAAIRPTSFGILDQVAQLLRANPDIKKVRIEGHTDSRGSRMMNIQLSQARANSVKQYLVRKGITSDRLVAKGFGPDQPLVEETDDAAMQRNRRVEFIIVE
ncbi:MAG: OmpA family protein, partial [Myxococcota bacterium]